MVSNKDQSRLSATYIRCLVKQLAYSSSRMNPKDAAGKKNIPAGNSGDGSSKSCKISQSQPQTQTHKKQVRRRLHTSRPYQERLLNMAEARREIVTALKQHRAAMKQASEQQKLLQQQRHENAVSEAADPVRVLQPHTTLLEQEAISSSKSNLNPNYYTLDPFSYPYVPPPPLPPPPGADPFSWSISNTPNAAAFNFVLPNQPLGLNLNFQDFNNIIETTPLRHNPIHSSPPSSSSTSSPGEDIPHPTAFTRGLHQAVKREGMAEMRTIGENEHQMDRLNVMTSAWWLEVMAEVDDGDVFRQALDEGMEFPPWLMNPKEDLFLQPCLSDYSSSDDLGLHDPALSCMEIGEIEGMDEDWLA